MATNRLKSVERSAPAVPDDPESTKGLSRAELYALGKQLRNDCPRKSHAVWKPDHTRPDPVRLVLEAEKGRLPDLLPLRHARMAASPFTFYRGSALTMAADLASTPVTNLHVQCCGDAHLCNFGGFATPERRVIFSINDLDETLPAPWEWDVKRLAASFLVASRDNGLSDTKGTDAVMTCVRTYREAMAEFSQMKTLELWYAALDADELVAGIKDPKIRRRGLKRLQKERGRSVAEDIFPKLVEQKGEIPIIKDELPTIFHREDTPPGVIPQAIHQAFAAYRATLPPSYQSLLDRYEIRDVALKVVGIGSVGTSCVVYLLMAGEGDPLFLQVKEARASVLERYAGASKFSNHGQRVVNGYRLMQPASDIFLGLDPRREGFTPLLHTAVEGYQDQHSGGNVWHFRDEPLRHLVRQGPGALPRTVGIFRPAQRVYGEERRVRSGARILFGCLREPERKRPRRAETSHPQRQG
jgi:uncharacterized protein (DUF2252 family)